MRDKLPPLVSLGALIELRISLSEVTIDISAAPHQVQPVVSRRDTSFRHAARRFSPACALRQLRCGCEVQSGATWCGA